MKTITGKVNFLLEAYTLQMFLDDMDKNNCQVLDIKRSFTSYFITVRGRDEDLDSARWFFRNCGSLL